MSNAVIGMRRVEDWQSRLRSTIAQWQKKDFVWGKTDCFCFAAACVEALVGKNPMQPVLGEYKSQREAYKHVLKGIKGKDGTFYKADGITGYIGLAMGQEKPVSMAQRGDVVLCNVEGANVTGIMSEDGKRIWAMCDEKGMVLLPIEMGVKAWGV